MFEPPTLLSPLDSPPPDQPIQEEIHPLTSIADKLSYFTEYITSYPGRGVIKGFGLLGLLTFGAAAGVLLVNQAGSLDLRKQASEGNKILAVCQLKDPAQLATKAILNSTGCLLNGQTYYACDSGYTYSLDQNLCLTNSPGK